MPSSSSHRVLSFLQQCLKKTRKNVSPMKEIFVAAFAKNEACIDEFQPNAIQANYLEGFWRITSKKQAIIEVRMQ